MKYLNGEYYVEVKGHRYKIHPTKTILLRKRDPPLCLRTQYQVQIKTQIGKNQKAIRNDIDELLVKKIFLKTNNQSVDNKNLNLLFFLIVNETIG